jgi:hypothetical protein
MTYHLQYQYLRQPGKQRNPKEKNTYILTICCTFVQRLSLSHKNSACDTVLDFAKCSVYKMQTCVREVQVFSKFSVSIFFCDIKKFVCHQKLLLFTLHYKEFITDSKLLKGDINATKNSELYCVFFNFNVLLRFDCL